MTTPVNKKMNVKVSLISVVAQRIDFTESTFYLLATENSQTDFKHIFVHTDL